ncbi:MAG: CPBP family intramembrane metalloprotease [Verrucomicrobia bacterium]|nr:CPBP family intramembrane metalloprotease [Verrucomicrobiota bacterium]
MAPDQIPLPLMWTAIGLDVLSLGMLAWVLFRWRRRVAQGFSLGRNVGCCPLALREWLLLVFLMLLGFSQLFLIQGLLQGRGWLNGNREKAVFVIFSQAVLYLLFLFLLHALLRLRNISWKDAFGLHAADATKALWAGGAGLIATWVPLEILSWSSLRAFEYLKWPSPPQPILQLFLKVEEPWVLAGLCFVAIIGAPLIEEILFRGLVYSWLKMKCGFLPALAGSSALFAAFHCHAPSALPLFGLAVALALLYEWKGNLAACVIMHAGFNALSLTLFLLFERGFR